MNLAAAFAVCAEKNWSRTALCWGDKTHHYGLFLQQTVELAAHLQEKLGVRPGDRVGLWLKNCPEFVPALFGILSAGGVVVPINSFLKPNEVAYILNDAGIDLLISDRSMSEQIAVLQASCPGTKVWHVEDF